ncbi:MAG: glycosyltransferase [Bacteroidales bacterium]|nr:glycosyltransferase [Bacteroidales bacterium]
MFELQIPSEGYILLLLFAVSLTVQLFYYFFFYIRTGAGRKKRKERKAEPVSVVICARNEAENLKSFLPSVLEQDYHDFEVVVVNDCSDDDSEDVLERFTKEYKNLKVTTIHKESSLRHSKKMALFLGIKAAGNDLLLLTDADCQPVSSKWISGFASSFTRKTGFVLGYGAYLRKKGLLNKYIRYDAMFIGMQYLGMALAGLPYMGVGRNLAYRKSLFLDNKGFGPHLNLQSGDDDLFVNQLANRKNTRVNLSPGSITRSIPSATWKQFFKQKTRHMSTASHYRPLTKFLLVAEPVSRVLFYASFIILMLTTGLYLPLGIAAGTVILAKLITFILVQRTLNEKDLLLFSLLFDIFSPVINMFFLISVALNRHQYYEWK